MGCPGDSNAVVSSTYSPQAGEHDVTLGQLAAAGNNDAKTAIASRQAMEWREQQEIAAQAQSRQVAAEATRAQYSGFGCMRTGIGCSGTPSSLGGGSLGDFLSSVNDHLFVSGSFCFVVGCLSLTYQRERFTGGVQWGLSIPEINPKIGDAFGDGIWGMRGVSIGWNTAVPADQGVNLATVTAARGPWGGTFGVGRRASGGYYYQYGWAYGMGANVSIGNGLTAYWDLSTGKGGLVDGGGNQFWGN